MEIRDNFSKVLLIAEKPVIFYFPNFIDVAMNLPKIEDSFTDQWLQIAISFISLDLSELKKYFPSYEFSNLWNLIFYLNHKTTQNEITYALRYLFKFAFSEQFTVNKEGDWYLKGIKVDEVIFNRVIEIIQIATCAKKFEDQKKFQWDKPAWLLEKEALIRKIKGQNHGDATNDGYNQIQKIFMQINYELGYSFEELFKMNFFHIQMLQSYIPKIIGYDIQKRGKSVGLIKGKLKYITD